MYHLIAAVAFTVAASAPCPVSPDAARAFVPSDIAQEIAVLEVLQDAQEAFAARVADLGLTGAAPLFGASPEAPAYEASLTSFRDAETAEPSHARRARSAWPAR